MNVITRMIRSLFGLSKSDSDDNESEATGVTVERETTDGAATTDTASSETGDIEEPTDVGDEPGEKTGASSEEADENEEGEPGAAEDGIGEASEEAEDAGEETVAPAGEDEPVDSINGIGPTYGDRLAEAGIGTVAALAASDPETVAEAADAPESRASEWIEQAKSWE